MPSQKPLWMLTALGELGVHEIAGPAAGPRIIEYDATTTLKAISDEVPWCSSFVNWVLTVNKIKGTDSASAASWLSYGTACPLAYGAISVFSRVGGHHVGFVIDSDDNLIWLLSGNSANQVRISPSKRIHLLDTRWPQATSTVA